VCVETGSPIRTCAWSLASLSLSMMQNRGVQLRRQ
jgi:hypothetical protein